MDVSHYTRPSIYNSYLSVTRVCGSYAVIHPFSPHSHRLEERFHEIYSSRNLSECPSLIPFSGCPSKNVPLSVYSGKSFEFGYAGRAPLAGITVNRPKRPQRTRETSFSVSSRPGTRVSCVIENSAICIGSPRPIAAAVSGFSRGAIERECFRDGAQS